MNEHDADHDQNRLLFTSHPYNQMKNTQPVAARAKGMMNKMTLLQILSYVLDWAILIAVGVIGLILGDVTPNKRHFSLTDTNIAFPFTEHETVDSTLLMICNAVIPIAVILVVTLVFVPGSTVPEGTPKSLIWKRKLWELHVGWLGLATALCSAWIITQGMKNLFGKPRPDMLSRCQPDANNFAKYLVGYPLNSTDGSYNGQLVHAGICTSTDHTLLDDGFRSYPSGHSSSAAAGLLYLSLFLASKFAITIPFVPQEVAGNQAAAASAFPSRIRNVQEEADLSSPSDPMAFKQYAAHRSNVAAVRKQAAAPPLYLLLITVLPFFLAIFVASSRWFDFRHHGFDILFGFFIGVITGWFAFRFYHLPLRSGAGWAWGPRSHDKAFWAGVGSYSYATDKHDWNRPGDEEERIIAPPKASGNHEDIELSGMRLRPEPYQPRGYPVGPADDVSTIGDDRSHYSR